jgi:hypothetical protein
MCFDPELLASLVAGIRRSDEDIVAPINDYQDGQMLTQTAGGSYSVQSVLPMNLGTHERDIGQFPTDTKIQFGQRLRKVYSGRCSPSSLPD